MPPKDWKGIQLGYVNHSQAEKLKKLGFNCYCRATWIRVGFDEWGFEEKDIDEVKTSGEKFLAPTVEHALKWIRRTHKIFVGSARHEGHSWLDIIDEKNEIRLPFLENRFLDREDADMHGLDVSLLYLESGSSSKTISIDNTNFKSLNA